MRGANTACIGRGLLPFVVGGLLVLLLPVVAVAATESQKQQAINDGLAYLAGAQQADGRWNQGDDYYDTATTGAALLSFLEEGYTAGNDVVIDGTNYGDVVGDALSFIMSKAQKVNISNQTYGDPDAGKGVGAGLGVKFVLGGTNNKDTYVTGLVLSALARTGTPNATVTNGQLTGWTYKEVVQNTVDYFAYGQNESGIARGGWRYYANSGDSDNSTAQWPAVGMLFAQSMGVSTPGFVKNELDVWTDYIQYWNTSSSNHGGSGYNRPYGGSVGISESKTGGLLVEMLLSGKHTLSDAQVQAAIDYLDLNWDDTISGTWYGNFDSPYAMWSIYKGLEGWIGLEGDLSSYITPGAQGSAVIDSGDTWNWYEEYCEWLVDDQNANGGWSGNAYWTNYLATAWHINILNATTVQDPVVPEPSTIALLGLGLAGLAYAGARRRRKGS